VWAPTPVPALAGAALVRPGQHHTLALAASGALLSAGRPTYGRLGRAGADPASDDALPAPAPVEGLDGVDVAGAAAGALAVSCAGVGCAEAVAALRRSTAAVRPSGTGCLCWVGAALSKGARWRRSAFTCARLQWGLLRDGLAQAAAMGETVNTRVRAGLAVSGCVSAAGDAWLWGFGTNSQLGKGDDDADELLPRRLAETKRFQVPRAAPLASLRACAPLYLYLYNYIGAWHAPAERQRGSCRRTWRLRCTR